MLSTVFRSQTRHVILPCSRLRGWRPLSSSVTNFYPEICLPINAAHLQGVVLEERSGTSANTLAGRRLQPPQSVFEDFTNEYARQASGGAPQTNERAFNQVLERLILKGDFEGAAAAKKELTVMGTSLGKNPVYVKAAQYSLERRADLTHGRLFLEWWSLVPDDSMWPHIKNISTSLMQPPTQMDLVKEFSILCSKAGNANPISKHLLPFIFRHLEAASALQFIRSFLDSSPTKLSPSRRYLLNQAARYNFMAGRRREGFRIVEQMRGEGLEVSRAMSRAISRNHVDKTQRQFSASNVVLPKVPSGVIASAPPPQTMSRHLKLLCLAVNSTVSENLPSFASSFIIAYEDHYKRTRALDILRKRVSRNRSLPLLSAWVAAEQVADCKRGRPLPVLRSFLHYCLPANVPIKKLHELVLIAEKRREVAGAGGRFGEEGSHLILETVRVKFWPNAASLSAVWKSVIQLAEQRKDLEELYAAMLLPLEMQRNGGQTAPGGFPVQSTTVSTPVSELPDSIVFHHFITAFATRYGGQHGAKVLADMSRLGVKQSMENWTALAGVYARSADVERVNDILSFLEKSFRGSDITKNVDDATFRSKMLVTYNSILRGFADCFLFEEARRIQNRMNDLGYFKDGTPKRTKAILHRLSRYEKGKHDAQLAQRRRMYDGRGRKLYIDPQRVDWIGSEISNDVSLKRSQSLRGSRSHDRPATA